MTLSWTTTHTESLACARAIAARVGWPLDRLEVPQATAAARQIAQSMNGIRFGRARHRYDGNGS